ncbi:T9SS type A sorting domain-containing protein [uncultured Aquimarina sp.]|uniref:right-handed parallel beta-helix repeat-containing protein n=1 Tax=uncultured Aquimarina sp. TaxID=575652 RepID=UPI0026119188|nr:T9SS type A sorting domain-containing protein [uncultured Aquimarina sp.]
MKNYLTFLLLLLFSIISAQNTYYIANSGNDNNNGSINNPFKTIQKAINTINGGDLIYLRSGTYYPKKTLRINGPSGSAQNRTRLFAFPGEQVIIDGSRFTEFDPDENDNDLFRHQVAYWHYKDLEIRNAPSTALEIVGSQSNGNIIENLKTYDNGNTGIALYAGASNTLILNCDSYRNFDRQNGGQDADGFAAKFGVGPGNKFEGCRAWSNSDDGWDMWMADSSVLLENCWAYKNGFDIWNFGSTFEGNGDGFKFGRGKGPHIVKNCLAWGNDLRGFNSNSNESNLRIYNCTSWNNDLLNFGFNFGSGNFVLRNNLSFQGNINVPQSKDAKFNSWNSDINVTVDENDFRSLSSTIAEGQRSSNKGLPISDFLKLSENSDLIDKGVSVNIPFSGSAPDLGAYETGGSSGIPSTNGIGRMEAEKMTLSNYEINAWGNEASQSNIIKVINSNSSASASYTFTDESANYDIVVRYRDETDGASFYNFKINGSIVHSWTADEITVAPDTWFAPSVVKNIKINKNSIIEIEANADGGEPARLDYIEIKPITITSVSNGVGRMEAEEMALNNYEINAWSDQASQSSIIKVIDRNVSASAGYTFTGPTSNYDIIVRYRDEIDGNSFYNLKINGSTIHSWTADEATIAPDIWFSPSVIKNITINKNSTIEIEAYADGGEPARLDYIEITPATSNPEEGIFYVSTSGNDNNDGSENNPFRTIEKAIQTVKGGNLIYLRGGTYYPRKQLKIERASGTSQNKTRFFGFPGEKVIIDGSKFSDIAPNVLNNNIFIQGTAFWHFKDLEIRNALNSAILVSGNTANGNLLENLTVHDNGNTGIGVYSGASNTVVINCDSYRNFDPINNGRDADGFAAKFNVGVGNRFIGCRAWANADDGWDFWDASNRVTIQSCWAYKNGFDRWNVGERFQGDGDGFKFGRGSGNHVILNSASWGNDLRGFNSNANESNLVVFNNTAWNNPVLNFAFNFGTGSFFLRNNLSLDGQINVPNRHNSNFNSWDSDTGVVVTEGDFKSLSSSIAEGPRSNNNELPVSDFLKLRDNSDLIDKGVETGDREFFGSAPDLGAFESFVTNVRNFDNSSSISEFNIFPNPVSNGTLSIQFSGMDTPHQISIYNIEGKKLKTLKVTNNAQEMKIDISSLIKGMYILKTTGAKQVFSKKLIIN